MRLIDTVTYELEDHQSPREYAILSHTWREGQEVLYADFLAKKGMDRTGYQKIQYLCTHARRNGIKYAWIDTVCIDKSSSAELSEAINSMFMWYGNAKICYVYLDDTDDVASIAQSRWLTRGWTLQELLAPRTIEFYGKDWILLGTKDRLIVELVRWTGIDQIVLEDVTTINLICAAARMSWAAERHTTRIEDMAYCLLGIFDINLPLLYGEGKKAFTRLQQEIVREHQDLTILAFARSKWASRPKLLADSPSSFSRYSKIVSTSRAPHCEVISRGLRLEADMLRLTNQDLQQRVLSSTERVLFLPRCRVEFDQSSEIALEVEEWKTEETRQSRPAVRKFVLSSHQVQKISREALHEAHKEDIMLLDMEQMRMTEFWKQRFRNVCQLRVDGLIRQGYEVLYAEPLKGIGSWDPTTFVSEIVAISEELIVRKFGFVHYVHDEAFIVMFAMNRTMYPGVLLRTKMKPKETTKTVWLRQEGMYELIPSMDGPDIEILSNSEKLFRVEGNTWEYLTEEEASGNAPVTRSISLRSGTCFSTIEVRINFDRSFDGCWTIHLEGSHDVPDETAANKSDRGKTLHHHRAKRTRTS